MLVRLPAVFALLLVAVMAIAPVSANAGSSPVILTIVGNIEETNRGARDDFRDAFLKFREKTFDKAFEFSLDDLAKLKQVKITAHSDGWPKQVTLAGPRLADVLEAAGAAGKPIAVMALDGYEVEYATDKLAEQDWILALSADGRPLGIGQRGPLWLAFETKGEKVGEHVEANWVWSVFVITVQ